MTAPSPDNAGLWDPNRNNRIAGYMFNEFKFSADTKVQIAGRIERVNACKLRVELSASIFVEQRQRALRCGVPVAVGGGRQTADAAQFVLNRLREIAGPRGA